MSRDSPARPAVPIGTFVLSPQVLCFEECPCHGRFDLPSNAADFMTTTLKQFKKVFARLANTVPPAQAVVTAERVTRQLRREGHELFHLAGIQHRSNQRAEYSFYFLVPSTADGGQIGHRWLAEIMIHFLLNGKVENIAERYSVDWEDWTIYQERKYLRDEGTAMSWVVNPKPFNRDGVRYAVGLSMIKNMLKAVYGQLGGQQSQKNHSMVDKLARLCGRLRLDDPRPIVAAEVERVYLSNPIMGFVTFVRIALQQDQGNGHTHVPATILLEADVRNPQQPTIATIALAYKDEWPIRHHFRRSIPAPQFDDLVPMLQDGKSEPFK